jgi:hypothetical protein
VMRRESHYAPKKDRRDDEPNSIESWVTYRWFQWSNDGNVWSSPDTGSIWRTSVSRSKWGKRVRCESEIATGFLQQLLIDLRARGHHFWDGFEGSVSGHFTQKQAILWRNECLPNTIIWLSLVSMLLILLLRSDMSLNDFYETGSDSASQWFLSRHLHSYFQDSCDPSLHHLRRQCSATNLLTADVFQQIRQMQHSVSAQ